MTVAVYIRVSTSSLSEAGQMRGITKWLTRKRINPEAVVWYVDNESDGTLTRPEFEQLQRDIFNGAIKTVVVYKLDRLSRSLQDGVDTLCSWCKQGIRVVSTSQQIDFTGTIGQLIAAVLSAVAEMEINTRRESQAAGIAVAKEKGIYRGRKKGAVKAGVDVSKASKLIAKGLSIEETAKILGVSARTVYRYLDQTK
jgi:DNA invertase Pin-like site-specific DNA recombinase